MFGIGFGPVGDPRNLLYYFDAVTLGNGLARIRARQIDELPAWSWSIVANGAIVGRIGFQPGKEASVIVPLPADDPLRLALLPDGYQVESLEAYWAESGRCVITWQPVDCDSFEIYSDQGLGGAVDFLLATVEGLDTRYTTDELDPGTYVFNVIPVRNGVRAAPIDDPSHEDITHTVTPECLPPENLAITNLTLDGSGDYQLTLEWDDSATAGATYEYAYALNSAINDEDPADWSACTSPLNLTVAGAVDDLFLLRIRAVKGGYSNGNSRTLHLALPDIVDLFIPKDATPRVVYVRQDGAALTVGCGLRSSDWIDSLIFDLQYSTDLETWDQIDNFAQADAHAVDLGAWYKTDDQVFGLAKDTQYYIRLRARTDYERTDWGPACAAWLRSAPALATFNEVNGA